MGREEEQVDAKEEYKNLKRFWGEGKNNYVYDGLMSL